MKILIGTPIHMIKDYCMERWLDNVAKLQKVTPADLLLVDNSPGTDYVEKVKGYCNQLDLKKYEIKHLEIPQGKNLIKDLDEQIHERVTRCREIIRRYILSNGYDIWFSWECDQIIPDDSLNKLVDLMKRGKFLMVNHNGWDRDRPDEVNLDFGVALASRECLERYGFIPTFKSDSESPGSWYEAEYWYRQRLLKDNCNFLEVYGVINPILHLNK